MKNITVSIDEPTHRQAKIKAAKFETSLSALVRVFLNHLAAEPQNKYAPGFESETPRERRRGLVDEAVAEVLANGGGLRMSENLPREAPYERNVLR